MAGMLRDVETDLAAHTILFSLSSYTYLIFFGVSLACNIRVGVLLGELFPLRPIEL